MSTEVSMYVEIKNKNNEWKIKKINNSYEGIYEKRNYNTFAILSNVRNSDNKIKPISRPKGVPTDASKFIKRKLAYKEDSWDELYPLSYVTLEELLNYNWEDKINVQLHITLEEYKNLKPNEHPKSWFLFSLDSIQMWKADQMVLDDYNKNTKVQFKKELPLKEVCYEFYYDVIPKLKNLSKDNLGQDVRLILHFY